MDVQEAIENIKHVTGLKDPDDIMQTVNLKYQNLPLDIRKKEFTTPMEVVVWKYCFETITIDTSEEGPSSLRDLGINENNSNIDAEAMKAEERRITAENSERKSLEDLIKEAEYLLSGGKDKLEDVIRLVYIEGGRLVGMKLNEILIIFAHPETIPEEALGKTYNYKGYKITFTEDRKIYVDETVKS